MYGEFSFYDLSMNLEIEIVHDFRNGCIFDFQLKKNSLILKVRAVFKLKFYVL